MSILSIVEEQFMEFMELHVPDYRQKKYVLAVSGGMDSMLLMHLFRKHELECIVAHCNYHLRGAESTEDEQFVKQESERLGFPCFTKRFDTRQEKEKMLDSIQVVARKLRYTWFESLLLENQCDYVCTAHHQRDNAETLLQHFMQGAYPESMQGIKPMHFYLIRPLLYIPYSDLAEYAKETELAFRTDSSNLETGYLRNKIRHKLLPVLEEIFGAHYQDQLEDAARRYKHYFDLLHQQASSLIEPAILYEEIDIDKLRSVFGAPALLYEAIKDYGFNFEQCHSVCSILDRRKGSGFESHDRKFKLLFAGDVLQLVANKKSKEEVIDLRENDTQQLICNGHKITIQLKDRRAVKFLEQGRKIACINYDLCAGKKITIDKWESGDWFIPLGMKGKKKLSDFLTDIKISPAEKMLQQVLKVEDEIAWVVGHRIDERYRITEYTRQVLICELE